jgi:hypothetical protein
MNEDPVVRVRIEAPTVADLREFTDEIGPADLGCRAIPRQTEGSFVSMATSPKHDSRGLEVAARPIAFRSESSRTQHKRVANGKARWGKEIVSPPEDNFLEV